MFSDFMATFFANGLPYIGFLWAIAFALFVELIMKYSLKQQSSLLKPMADENENDLMSKGAQIFPIVALLFAVLCILCPIRLIIQMFCLKTYDIEDSNKKYSSRISTFPTDYDKENPLTKKRGEERWLDIQIKEADDAGDTDKVKFLRGQVEEVKNQTAFSQMQSYAM